MAQTNYTPISLYYSTTASAVPTAANLVPGELAINTNDGKLYYEDSSGVVRVLASKSTGTVGGSTTQVQFNNSGSLGGSSGLTWDGSFLTTSSIKNSALTSGRVTYAGASGLLSDSAGLTYDGTNLTTTGTATATRFIPSGSTVATNGMYLPAANTLGFSTNSTNVATIDANGNLGIGVTPVNLLLSFGYKNIELPKAAFYSFAVSSSRSILGLKSNIYYDASANALYVGNGYGTQYQTDLGEHAWYNAPNNTSGAGASATLTQAMTLNASGGLQVLNTIGVGNTAPSTSGAGITFPATQSASSNANTLDDYEEGTFTVTMATSTSGTITMDSAYQTMAYTKIGRLVMVTGEIVVASVSLPVGTVYYIQGLPFTCANLTQESGTSGCSLILGGSPFTVIPATIGEGETSITVRQAASTVAANWNPRINFSYFSAN